MIFLKYIISILGLVLLLNLSAIAQDNESVTARERIPVATYETVDGNTIELDKLQRDAYLFFLLPKPESKSSGKEKMELVRKWIEKIESETDNVFVMLIAEPYKTSFPFFGIQKRKLTKEPYPVLIDKEGLLLNRFETPDTVLNLIIANRNLIIEDRAIISADTHQIEAKVSLLRKLTAAKK